MTLMALVILFAICFFACGFLLYALVQWVRDGKRKSTSTKAHPEKVSDPGNHRGSKVVALRRDGGRGDQSSPRSRRAGAATRRSAWNNHQCNFCERVAYERIARSLLSRR